MHGIMAWLRSRALSSIISVVIGMSAGGAILIWMAAHNFFTVDILHSKYALAQSQYLSRQSYSYQLVFIIAACLQLLGAVFLWKRKPIAVVFFVAQLGCAIFENAVYQYIVPVSRIYRLYLSATDAIFGVILCLYVLWVTSWWKRKKQNPI